MLQARLQRPGVARGREMPALRCGHAAAAAARSSCGPAPPARPLLHAKASPSMSPRGAIGPAPRSLCLLCLLCPSLQTLRHLLVPARLPQHMACLLRLLLDRLQRWPASGQLELAAEVKALVFEASVGALFGERFLEVGGAECSTHRSSGGSSPRLRRDDGNCPDSAAAAARARRLQADFFAFEEGFELAASPVPHILQPRFLGARRRLVAALRCRYSSLPPCAHPGCPTL